MNGFTNEGLSMLKNAEGLNRHAYYDVKGWAIGRGMHYYSNGNAVQEGDVITTAFAESEFLKVLGIYGKSVSAMLKNKVSDGQFTALVAYAYNRGIGSLRGSNLLKMVNKNPSNSAIPAQFAIEWGTNQTYKTALIKRRKLEGILYKNASGVDVMYYVQLTVVGIILYYAYHYYTKKSHGK